MFDTYIFIFIGFAGLLVFAITVYKDIFDYLKTKKGISFIPTFTGLFFLLVILGLNLYINNKTTSATIIKAFYDGDYNGFSIDLKENGEYIMENGSAMGATYYYGMYSMKDSTITLDVSNIDNVLKSNRLVLRTIQNVYPQDPTADDAKQSSTYLIQIDSQGRELTKGLRFRVTEDKRNMKSVNHKNVNE